MGWTATHIPTMGNEQKVAMMSFVDAEVPVSNVLGGASEGFSQLMRPAGDH